MASLAASSLVSAAAVAQMPVGPTSTERVEWRTVDQVVEDLNPIAASQRSLPGGRSFLASREDYRLETPVDYDPWAWDGRPVIDPQTGLPLPQQYRFRAPGVQARLPRPTYIVQTGRDPKEDLARDIQPVREDLFADQLPANVVFELVPEAPPAPSYPDWIDHRVSGRADARMDQLVETRLGLPETLSENGQFGAPTVARDDARPPGPGEQGETDADRPVWRQQPITTMRTQVVHDAREAWAPQPTAGWVTYIPGRPAQTRPEAGDKAGEGGGSGDQPGTDAVRVGEVAASE